MAKRRVVITGMGVITALGESLELLWDNIIAGKSGVSLIQKFDTSEYPVKIGGEITTFNTDKYIDSRSARRIDPFAIYGLAAAKNAVEDSGINFDNCDRDRCGVLIGTGIGGLQELEKEHKKLLLKSPDRVSPFCVPKLMVNAASGNVAIEYGLRGSNYCVVTACAAASHSIGEAFRLIQNDYEDVMITGGSEAALTGLGLASFCSLKALSRRNDEPEKASRPFDRDRGGFVLAEGAGAMVLEEYELAKKRGANIYAELVGFGMTCDAEHITAPCADGRGAQGAIKKAIQSARINPDQIDYISAHGTGTLLNDSAETMAIKAVLGESAKKTSISSTKSHLGHTLGASGGIELVISALAMKNSVIPPTINLDNPGEGCDLDYTPLTPKERDIKYAMKNSFGFGGHNACLVIGKI